MLVEERKNTFVNMNHVGLLAVVLARLSGGMNISILLGNLKLRHKGFKGRLGIVKEIKVYLYFLNLFLCKPTRRVQPHNSTFDSLSDSAKGILHAPVHQPYCSFSPFYP